MKPHTRVRIPQRDIKGLGPEERDIAAARQKPQVCLPWAQGSLEPPKLVKGHSLEEARREHGCP